MLAHYLTQGSCGLPRNGLRRRKQRVIFTLTKVLRAKQFWQAHQSCTAFGGLAYTLYCLRKIRIGRGFAGHLNERNARSNHKIPQSWGQTIPPKQKALE